MGPLMTSARYASSFIDSHNVVKPGGHLLPVELHEVHQRLGELCIETRVLEVGQGKAIELESK